MSAKRLQATLDGLIEEVRYSVPGFTAKLKECPIANADHEKSWRQFMHTNHYDGVICYAAETVDLPHENICGLLAHEIGHMVGGESEDVADRTAEWLFGQTMFYDDDDVEWMDL